jgi:hypothetical protein
MDVMRVRRVRIGLAGMLVVLWTMLGGGMAVADAQTPAGGSISEPQLPAPALELTAGYAGFVDDALLGHRVVGLALRGHLSPRISVGPEVVYMAGTGDHRDLFLTANVTFDLLSPRIGRAGRVTPFLVAGGGLMRSSDRFGSVSFSSTEGAVTGGGGMRAWVTPRVYVASEFRVGWELHFRVTGTVGVALQ